MKNTIKAFIFFTVLTTQAFAGERNLLEDACGHVALSSEQIDKLYSSWGDPTYVAIGADVSSEGLQNTPLDHLANISFDSEDVNTPRELVAERETLGSAKYRAIQYCPEK